MEKNGYKRYAFISYNHKDVAWAKWLHKKLEGYKLPSEIHNEFEDSKYLRPVFRDQEDLNTGILSETLKENLESSKYLVVICSPNSAKSKWVNDEVRTFIEWGRLDRIIPLVIDGIPHNYADRDIDSPYEDECFPPILRRIAKEDRTKELLGVSIAEVGKHKAFVRIVSKMLDVSFDTLWKRHQRDMYRKITITSVATPIIALLIYWFAIPVEMTVRINDENHRLPFPEEGGKLTINGSEYSVSTFDTIINIKPMPGFYRLRDIEVLFEATYYDPINDKVGIGIGTSQPVELCLKRDKTFAEYKGIVMDEDGNAVSGAMVSIEDKTATTGDDGTFTILFPVDEQTISKRVQCTKEGYQPWVREDEGQKPQILLKKE